MELYSGLIVKVIGLEGIWEIVKVDQYTNSAWCKRKDITTHDLRDIDLQSIQRL